MAKRTHSHADRPNAHAEDEIDEAPAPSAKDLNKVIELSRWQVQYSRDVEKLEEKLAEVKAKLIRNKMVELPKAMEAANLQAAPLGKGSTVELEVLVTANIPSPDSDRIENAAERNAVGIAYMDKMAPSMVKNVITIEYAKGEDKFYNKLVRDLSRRKVPPEFTVKRTVHSGTLGKWVRDQDKAGKKVDEEALNVHRLKVATVYLPKKAKDKL
jgi:hypothetical protein